MAAATNQSDPIMRLAYEFGGPLQQARDDLRQRSNLHRDFIKECFDAIDRGKARLRRAPTGEIFPHLVAQGLKLPDADRRTLAAAWLALFGYICIVDHELDRKGYLNGRCSITASALLGWGVATLGRYTAGTPFANVFLDNINRAFAGQYEDILVRNNKDSDRRVSYVDKNRAMLAALAGFYAAAREPDDRVIKAAEALLGPFQILDDLQDLQQDDSEDNITIFVRIVRDCASAAAPLTRSDMYSAIIGDPRTKYAMMQVAAGLDNALLMLDISRDRALILFIGELRDRNAYLIGLLDDYQRNPTPGKLPQIRQQFERVFLSSST